MAGGAAQFVMFFPDYPSVHEATASLLFSPDCRLFREAPEMLLQELRDPTTYKQIFPALGGHDITTPQIAKQSGLDSKGPSPYLNRLQELNLVSFVDNPLSSEKRKHHFRISDTVFRSFRLLPVRSHFSVKR